MTATPSRRQVLSAVALPLAALPLAACTSSRTPDPPDPDDALRDAAVARERALLALYDAAPPAVAAKVAAVRADHEAHLVALLGGSPSPGAPTASPGSATGLPQLVAAERSAAAEHATAALSATRSLAAVLASLAACEASHPVALA